MADSRRYVEYSANQETDMVKTQEQSVPVMDEEMDKERLRALLTDNALPMDLVSAFAGDRQLTDSEKSFLESQRSLRGENFFSDLLYAITHQYFPPAGAEGVWNEMLRHKYEMSGVLKRNIRTAVASLDYLSNLKSTMRSATLIDEARIADIARWAFRDGLTTLFNHSTCYQKIEAEMKRYTRYGTVFALMMIDIDDFKAINDQYGHRAGDAVLSALGSVIVAATRDSDICCRYGGEEFAVILPLTDVSEAAAVAERLRARVADGMPGGRHVTVSVGIALCGPDANNAQALVDKADTALYQAKKQGKNRVMLAAA